MGDTLHPTTYIQHPTSNTPHPTLNSIRHQHQTVNTKPTSNPTPNIESNTQHPIQHPTFSTQHTTSTHSKCTAHAATTQHSTQHCRFALTVKACHSRKTCAGTAALAPREVEAWSRRSPHGAPKVCCQPRSDEDRQRPTETSGDRQGPAGTGGGQRGPAETSRDRWGASGAPQSPGEKLQPAQTD